MTLLSTILIFMAGFATSGSSQNNQKSTATNEKANPRKNLLILFTDQECDFAEISQKRIAQKFLKLDFRVYQYVRGHFVTYNEQERVTPDWNADKIIVNFEGHGAPTLFSQDESGRITREEFVSLVHLWRKSSNKIGVFMGFCYSGNWVPDILSQADLIVTGSCNKRKSSMEWINTGDENMDKVFRKSNPINTILGGYVFIYKMIEDRAIYIENKEEEDKQYETSKSGPNFKRAVTNFWDAADFGSDFPGWMRIRNDCTRHMCSATHVWKGNEEKLSDWFMEPKYLSIVSTVENRIGLKWDEKHTRAELLIDNGNGELKPYLDEGQKMEWRSLTKEIIIPKLDFKDQELGIVGYKKFENDFLAQVCFYMIRRPEKDEDKMKFTCDDPEYVRFSFATIWTNSELDEVD